MIDVRVSHNTVDKWLRRLYTDAKQHQKLSRFFAREVCKYTGQNIRRQRTVEGDPFAKRKKARAKRRMLLGLGKAQFLKAYSKAGDGGGAAVGWPEGGFLSEIAYRHQHGIGESWNPAKIAKVRGSPDYGAQCTPKQAQALIKEGYKLPGRRKGGGVRLYPVNARWLRDHMTLGQAGLILRLLRTGQAKGKQSWKDTVPERPFLGINDAQVEASLDAMIQKFLTGGKIGV